MYRYAVNRDNKVTKTKSYTPIFDFKKYKNG